MEQKRYRSISLRVRGDLLCYLKLIWVVQSSLQKYSAFPVGQIKTTTRAIPSREEGRIMIVTNVGRGCGGRGSVRRATWLQGGFLWACERSNGELTNDVAAYGEVVWS